MSPGISKISLEGFRYYLNCLNDDVDIPINVKYLRKIVEIALGGRDVEYIIYDDDGKIIGIV